MKNIMSAKGRFASGEKNFEKIGIDIAEKAGKALLKEFRRDDSSIRGTSKGIKTLFDLLADKIIKREIEKNFPEHSYLTEETGLIDKKSYRIV